MTSMNSLLSLFSLAALALLLPVAAHAEEQPQPKKLWVYVGTYTGPKSKGIYRMELDPATGKLTTPALAGETPSPSFLAIHPNQRFLYAVNETAEFGGKKNTGSVSAFAIDAKTGDLSLLNQQPTGGAAPCHVIVDKQGKNVLVANYSGGSVSVFPIQADGKLGEATAFVQHKGSSVNKERQSAPHAHSINLDAANRFAFVADLGMDKVMIYKFDPAKGTLTPNDPPSVSVAPGSGPRHFAFHPNGKYAYVINEILSTVTPFSYDAEAGTLKPLTSISTLPKGFKGSTSTAEVQVHPSGKFVYGSNRGHNSITIFAIDEKTGELTLVGHQAEKIKTPRNFAIDPTGNYLLVENQDGHNIIEFRIDQKTGELSPTGTVVEVGSPVCIKMMAKPE